MALPVAGEEEANHASDSAGYARLPADHLSDSSESSYGPSDDLMYGAPDVFSDSEALVVSTHDSSSSIAHTEAGRPSYQNGGSVDRLDATGNRVLTLNRSSRHMDNQAASHNNSGASHNNGLHIDVQAETQNSGLLYTNGGHSLPVNQVHDQTMENYGTPHGGQVININGLEIHVYGQLAGLQLSSAPHHTDGNHNDAHATEDVDENERQRQEDAAMLRAQEAEEARRLAPLPPEHCQAIKEAMQRISLGGYKPEWADKIPEDQWLNSLRRK